MVVLFILLNKLDSDVNLLLGLFKGLNVMK